MGKIVMAGQITPIQVANEFIRLAGPQGLTNLALQKLTYIAHGWHLAVTGKPLVEEDVAAWKLGPVFPSLYHLAKEYKSQPVVEPFQTMDIEPNGEGGYRFTFETPALPDDADEAKAVIRNVWDKYGFLTAGALVDLTHAPGTPWSIVTEAARKKHGREFWNIVRDLKIPPELIESHYMGLWKQQALVH